MNRRRLVIAAACTCAAVGLLTSAAFAQDVTLKIGKLLELTGPLSENGPSQDKAISIAVDYANQAAQAAGCRWSQPRALRRSGSSHPRGWW